MLRGTLDVVEMIWLSGAAAAPRGEVGERGLVHVVEAPRGLIGEVGGERELIGVPSAA